LPRDDLEYAIDQAFSIQERLTSVLKREFRLDIERFAIEDARFDVAMRGALRGSGR